MNESKALVNFYSMVLGANFLPPVNYYEIIIKEIVDLLSLIMVAISLFFLKSRLTKCLIGSILQVNFRSEYKFAT